MTVDASAAGTDAGLLTDAGTFGSAAPLHDSFDDQTPTATPTADDPLGGTQTALDAYQQQIAEQQHADYMASLSPATVGGIPINTVGGKGGTIVQAAEKLLGTPYTWGGTGPNGIDCSGLVQWAYKQAGISLPRISFQQARDGQRVGSMKDLRPGDLVAWDNSPRNPGADHIAIYLGGGKIIEAPHPGAFVRVRTLDANEGAWYIRMGW